MRGSSNYVKITALIRFNVTEVSINKTLLGGKPNATVCYS
jgi:hypothetical protein